MEPTQDVQVSRALICHLLLRNATSLYVGQRERTRVQSEKRQKEWALDQCSWKETEWWAQRGLCPPEVLQSTKFTKLVHSC